MGTLISIDTGVKLGMAVFNFEGKLLFYGSHNYGDINRLKRNIPRILKRYETVKLLVLEGGGELAEIWLLEAVRQQAEVLMFHAQQWRKLFF